MNTHTARVAIAVDRDRVSTAAQGARRWERLAARALRAAAVLWFVIAAAGQLFFALYVLVFYGRAALRGRPELWNDVLQTGYIPGDTTHNVMLASHLVFAFAITAGGVLQLIPAIRRTFPRFHRYNGRVYLASAAAASIAGLVMTWTPSNRGGDLSQHVAISILALLILYFGAMALRHALARRFEVHRRWALRLFLAVNGGWFFRVGLMLWIVLNRGPVGFDPKTFTGTFLTFLAFAEYVVPLGILELYFWAQRREATRARLAVAGGLLIATLLMTVGIGAAAALMWWPQL